MITVSPVIPLSWLLDTTCHCLYSAARLSYHRLPARVIGKPYPNRYQLQTAYGILKHHYGARHPERFRLAFFEQYPIIPLLLPCVQQLYPAAQLGQLEPIATAKPLAIQDTVAV